jgi:NTE family protein
MADFSRRDFLTGLGLTPLAAGAISMSFFSKSSDASESFNDNNKKEKTGAGIGLALGSGGASGLAHILVLETLEEIGLKPAYIAGSSIGAVIGGFIASGHDSKTIREVVEDIIPKDFGAWLGSVFKKDKINLLDLFKVDMDMASLADPRLLSDFLKSRMGKERFEDLKIPLSVTATDFWQRKLIVFDSGPLIEAVMASAALPGVFPPVKHKDRLLVDGGIINPVPYDLIIDQCDITIAVDVTGNRKPPEDGFPGYMDLIFNTFDIMQANVIKSMRRVKEPDIYLKPPVTGMRVLDFYRSEEIYKQAEPVKEELKRKLEKIYKT